MHFQVSAHLITMHIMQLLSLNSFKMYRVYKLDKQKLPPPSPTTMPLPPVPVYSWGMMKKDILSSNKVEAKRLPWYPVLLSSLDYKHLEDRDPPSQCPPQSGHYTAWWLRSTDTLKGKPGTSRMPLHMSLDCCRYFQPFRELHRFQHSSCDFEPQD